MQGVEAQPKSEEDHASAAQELSDHVATQLGARRRRQSRVSSAKAPTFYAAGFLRRAFGAFVDALVVLPISALLTWVGGALVGVHLPQSRHFGFDFWLDLLLASNPALLGIIGLTLAIASVYALVFQTTFSQTLGMRLAGIRIIDRYGDDLGAMRASLRTAGYLVSIATLGLGFAWIAVDSEHRALHDWIAGTHVIKSRAL